MKLRWRLLISFVVATLVPLGALGWLVRSSLVERIYADEHHRQLTSRVESATRRVAEQVAADRRAVDALCAHDAVIDGLLLDLATGRYGPATEQEMVRVLPPLMRGRRFDALFLLDARPGAGRGRILGSGHYPDQVGGRAELVDAIARAGDDPFVDEVRVRDGAGVRDQRELLTGCVVARDGAAVAVVAGRVLGDDYAAALLGDVSPVRLAVAPPAEVPSGASEITTFAGASGEPALTLHATIDDAPLEREIAVLRQRSVYLAIAALVLAILLALGFTLTLSRPLAELEEATRRVASGDLESQMRVRRRDEVGSAMEAFNEMTRELASTRRKLLRAERIAAWREVARRIAHEIKNPLQPIQMEIETMQKLHARKHPSFDEEFPASAKLILEEVRRLDDMVTEFSRFARLPRPKAAPVDLREIVHHVEGLAAREGEVQVILPTEPVTVRADREQLTQVLLNLVQNGLDAAQARHGEGGGTVRVTLEAIEGEEGDERAMIVVEDDGPGIAPADRLKVFEPYFTTKAKGTGLGLAIVHRIVGDHGGSIDVDDGIDGGAAFVIVLPAAGPPQAIEASLTDDAVPLSRPSDTHPE